MLLANVFMLVPMPALVLASVGVLIVALSRTLGWICYVVPLGWAGVALLLSVPELVKAGIATKPLVLLVLGLLPMLGWIRRYHKGDIRHPFPLEELPVAVLNPEAHRVIRTVDAYGQEPPEE